MQTDTQPKLISVRQAAQLAGLGENTLYRLIRRDQAGAAQGSTHGHLAACIVSLPGSHLRVRRAAFERWLDAEAG